MTTTINLQSKAPIEETDQGLVDDQNELGINPSLAEDTNVPVVAAESDKNKLNSKSNSKAKLVHLMSRCAKDRTEKHKLIGYNMSFTL